MLKESLYRDLALQGKYDGIPNISSLFNKYVPAFPRDELFLYSAHSSVGKTTLVKNIYVFNLIEHAIQNKTPLKIEWIALEESERQFRYTIQSYLLYKRYGLRLSMMDFESIAIDVNGRRRILSEYELKCIISIQEELELYLSYINLPNIATPDSILNHILNVAFQYGVFVLKGKELTREEVNNKKWDFYKRKDDINIIVVIDPVNRLLDDGGNDTKYKAIERLFNYLKFYANLQFGFHVAVSQQQAKELQSLDNIKANNFYPSEFGLADYKSSFNDCTTFIGLTNPIRYKIKNWNGYKLEELGSFFRVINIEKNRYGKITSTEQEMIPVLFDGCTGYLERCDGYSTVYQKLKKIISD